MPFKMKYCCFNLKEETEYIFRNKHLGQRQGIFQNVLLGISGEEVGTSVILVRGNKSFTQKVRRANEHCHLPCWSWPVQVILYCWSRILGRTSRSGHSYGIHISLEYETTKRNIKSISCAMIPKSVCFVLHRTFFSLTEK